MQSWVDAHMHFWNRSVMSYPWLSAERALDRDFEPTDLQLGVHVLSSVVMVEAGRIEGDWLREVEWVESLGRQWPHLAGMVAHADLENQRLRTGQLVQLVSHPLVKGVRRNVQDEPPGFVLEHDFVAGVAALAEVGLTFDLCVRHWQLGEVTQLVRCLPEVTFVLDHCGKPDIARRLLDPWRSDLARLAELPNVMCKLSGLATEADHNGWRTADVLPYLQHALMVFGPGRCMFGGDWPVATLATTYERWVEVVAESLAPLSDLDMAAVAAGNATRIYRLGEHRTVGDGL